jgi:hypothetical protein
LYFQAVVIFAVPAIAQMIRRAAELVLISEKQRAKHIRDDPTASFERLLRMEGVVGRVLDRMREMAAQARAEQSRQTIAHLIALKRAAAVEARQTRQPPAGAGTAPSSRHAPSGRRRGRQQGSSEEDG